MAKLVKTFISLLKALRENATCAYYNVSAIAVRNNKIVSIGYVGTPSHILECKEMHTILESFISFARKKNLSLKEYLEKEKLAPNMRQILIFLKYNNELHKSVSENKSKNIVKIAEKYLSSEEYINRTNGNIFKQLLELLKSKEFEEKVKNRSLSDYDIAKSFNFIHSKYEIHAEQNCLSYLSNEEGIDEFYCSHLPCFECAKLLILYKVKKLYYLEEYVDKRFQDTSEKFLKSLGIEAIKFN